MSEPLDHVIALLYEAVLDPSLNQLALDELKSVIGADTSLQHVTAAQGSPGFTVSTNVDPEAALRYQSYYASVDPWLAKVPADEAPGIVHHAQLIPMPAFELSEFYHDFLRPQDLYWGVTALIESSAAGISYVSAMRSRGAGDFAANEVRTLERLLPHLRTCIGLRRRLQLDETRRMLLEEALNSLQVAVLLVDGAARVLFYNASAEQALASCREVRIVDGYLRARRTADDRRLQALLTCATVPEELHARKSGALRLQPAKEGKPFDMLVAPFRETGALAGVGRPAAIVLFAGQNLPSDHRSLLLHQLFGYTPAEAECALRLAEGLSVSEIAEANGVATSTVRAHVRSLLSKSGVHRQGALIALIHRRLASVGVLLG